MFTMELPVDDKIFLIGNEMIKNETKLETKIYKRSTNTGLLLHYHSHTDKRYKDFIKDNTTSRLCAIFHNRDF